MITAMGIAFLVALMFAVAVCGDYGSLIKAYRATFIPKSWREFFFPSCPFCWLARAAAVFIAFSIYQPH